MSTKWEKLQGVDPDKERPSVYRRLQRVAWETATGVDTRDRSTFMMTLASWLDIADEQTHDLKKALQAFMNACKDPQCDLCIKGNRIVSIAEKLERTGEGEEI